MTLAVAALLAALGGCANRSGQRYHDSAMDFGAFRNVAILPFANLSRDSLAADRVRDVFSSMLLATGAVYVVPTGEVARAVGRVGVANPIVPSVDEVTKLGAALKADGIIVGVVKEYGEVRSGQAAANTISVSVQLFETTTGKMVWAAATTRGGVGFSDRLFGGGGAPLNDVTEDAVDDLLNKLFK
jgi:hypothetical protein